MYFEIWVELDRKKEVERKLREICDEVYEVFYDYHYIVKIEDENTFKR